MTNNVIFKEKENTKMAKSKIVAANEKIEKGVVSGYKKIEEGVVSGYKKIENGAVEGFQKMSDRFVDKFLSKEGESIEDAKNRLRKEQRELEQAAKTDMKKRQQEQQDIIIASIERSKNTGLKQEV